MERLAAGVRRFEFDAYLAPYDLSSFATWQRLSNHISAGADNSHSPEVIPLKLGRNAGSRRGDVFGSKIAIGTGESMILPTNHGTMIS